MLLRPDLSLLGSSYGQLTKILESYFEKIDKQTLKRTRKWKTWKTKLNSDESIICLDLKKLHTKVSLREVVEIALKKG